MDNPITSNLEAQEYVESVRQRLALIIPAMDSALMSECDNAEMALFGALNALRDCMEPLDILSAYLGA